MIIPSGITVTVTANNTSLLSGLTVSGTLKFTAGAKLSFSAVAIVQVNSGGSITGGNGGSQISFPSGSYSGPFAASGPYYYTNTGSGSGTLAVSLLSFKNEVTSIGVKILWETTAEINIDYYELQWSDAANNWKTIYTQNANNFSGTNNYNYVQSTGLATKNYYRLKTIEKNGEFSFSDIIMATKNNAASFQITPSVATNAITCKMASANLSSIKVTDISGKIINSIDNLKTTQYILQVSDLPKGIYFVTLIQNSLTSTVKFLKQ